MHPFESDNAPDRGDAVPASQPWRTQALWQQLEPWLPGLSIEVLAQTESTNSLLLERARVGRGRHGARGTAPDEVAHVRTRGGDAEPNDRQAGPGSGDAAAAFGRRAGDTQPALVVAEQQTLGRGRHGRTWHSRAGQSLTFSLALALAPRDWLGLSLAVGVALADALEPPEPGQPPRLGLKWPNDLWLLDSGSAAAATTEPGRKLGGVLIETVAVGNQRMVVVGVGLNIAPLEAAGGPGRREFSSGCASLREIDAAASAPAALHRIALPLVRALRQFEREGFGGFATAYARRDLLRGRAVETRDALQGVAIASGIAEGVGPTGALWLRTASGLQEVTSGEVSVRLAASDA